MDFNIFFKELKRRNVFKGTVSYLVFSWVLLQVVELISPLINAPVWIGKMILIILVVLLPVWIFISWYYEVTTDGIKKSKFIPQEKSITKKTGKKLNTFIIVFLTLAIALLFVDRFRIQSQNIDDNIVSNQSIDKSIAVLPFRDMSPNLEQAYFADGLAEELLNSLAKINELKVTSRTSAFSFKNKEIGIPEIAKKLNVSYILEGSVRTYDSLIRVSVKLVEANGDKNIWSQQWNKELKNIFKIQNEIAEAVAQNLQLRILDNIVPKVNESKTDAYALFLEARHKLYNFYDDKSLGEAETLINKSISLDSTYAAAHILLGEIYHLKTNHGYIEFETGKKLTQEVVIKAIQADSTYADSYAFNALLALDFERNIKKADSLANKALLLEPNNPAALEYGAEASFLLGDIEGAIEKRKKSVELDPVNDSKLYNLANTYYFAENYEAAEQYIKQCIALKEGQESVYAVYALALIHQQKYDEASIVIEKEPLIPFRLHIKAIIYHFINEKEKSKEALEILIKEHQESWSFQIATTDAMIEDPDNMYYWLEKAQEYNDLGLIELPVEPSFKNYRDDARFEKILRTIDYKF